MKKNPTEPNRKENLQEIIDFLIENGVSAFNSNMLINTNMPFLGGDRSIMQEVRDKNWTRAWDAVEWYVQGDY